MKIKLLSVAFSIALSAATTGAGAQKAYTHGVITYKTSMRGQDVETKEYFTTDSAAATFSAGPATIKLLSDANHKSYAVLVDVPAFAVKKAAIYTPDEVNEIMAALPTFTFVAGTETKQISGFNCTKVGYIHIQNLTVSTYFLNLGTISLKYTATYNCVSPEIIVKIKSKSFYFGQISHLKYQYLCQYAPAKPLQNRSPVNRA